MPVVLLIDGDDDYLNVATPISNPCPVGESIIYNGVWKNTGNSFQMFINIYGGSGDFLAINASGQVTSRIGGVINAGADSITENTAFKFEIARTATQYIIYLNDVQQYFRNYTSDLQSLIGFSYSVFLAEGQFHNCAVGTTNYYDANASVYTAGTPVITDTIAGNNATGVNMPTAAIGEPGSAWLDVGGGGISVTATLGTIEYSSNDAVVSLTGSVDVAATLGTISYSSNDTVVGLTGSVDVIATLGTIGYSSNNAVVQVSGEVNVTATLGAIEYSSNDTVVNLFGDIDVTATLGAINYNSNDASIGLTGDIDIVATLGAISYSSNDAVIDLTGGVNVNTTLGAIDYTSNDSVVTLQGQVSVVATLGAISYNSNNVTIQVGAGQVIGTVTAGFAGDLYSAGFKPSGITVNFKT